MKIIRLRKNTMIAGGFVPMETEATVPDKIAADLRARGQCDIIGDAPVDGHTVDVSPTDAPDEKPAKKTRKASTKK